MRRTPRQQVKDLALGAVTRGVYRGRLAEAYDGIGLYTLVSLAGSSVAAALKARVAAGDFNTGQTFPIGTPVTVSVNRGSVEILSLGSKIKANTLQLAQAVTTPLIVETSNAWRVALTGSPPGGWHLPGFDDSTYQTCVWSGGPGIWYDTSSPRWIHSADVAPASRSFRRDFTVDKETVTSANIDFTVDNYGDVYLNGTIIISRANALWGSLGSASVDINLFLDGANCLSIISHSDGVPPNGVYAVLTIQRSNAALIGESGVVADSAHNHDHGILLGLGDDDHPQYLTPDEHAVLTHNTTGGFEVIFDGGGVVLTTGPKLDFELPFACTLTSWVLLADQSGSIVIDIWKDTYANFPPAVGDSICSASKPTLSSQNKNQDTDITDWTGEVLAMGDILRFNIDSVATIQRAVLSLRFSRVL
jgi:hypothetical protein